MVELVGTASDQVPAMLATGRSQVTTIFTSLSERHPEGEDAAYLEWHSLDHRPEQHRLAQLAASFRLVSTSRCRAARAVSHERYDATDHFQTYLFKDPSGLDGFSDLSSALRSAGRTPYVLPPVERGAYRLEGSVAAPRIKVGADVLPWWPTAGAYLLIERGAASPAVLVDSPGVGGCLWGSGLSLPEPFGSRDNAGLQVSYLLLDADPAELGISLRGALEDRWAATGVEPLLAAPFYSLVSYDWGRFTP
jgi:hypothetical protein